MAARVCSESDTESRSGGRGDQSEDNRINIRVATPGYLQSGVSQSLNVTFCESATDAWFCSLETFGPLGPDDVWLKCLFIGT